MTHAALVLALAGGLLFPGGAAAQGGVTAPDVSEPCPATYPGDGAQRRRIARWMARGAAERGLPRELPVMAGIGESGLRNLTGSSYAGFFGMHLSLDEGDYQGFPDRPALQLHWFLDTAAAIRQRRLARGRGDPAGDDGAFGIWIADVERPAAENRSRYQQYLDEARTLIGDICPAPVVSDTQPPALATRIARRQRPLRAAGSLSARVRCPDEPCLAGLVGTVTVDGRARTLRAAPAEPPAGGAATPQARLPRAARRVLARGRSLRITVRALAVDAAANVAFVERRVRALPGVDAHSQGTILPNWTSSP